MLEANRTDGDSVWFGLAWFGLKPMKPMEPMELMELMESMELMEPICIKWFEQLKPINNTSTNFNSFSNFSADSHKDLFSSSNFIILTFILVYSSLAISRGISSCNSIRLSLPLKALTLDKTEGVGLDTSRIL